MRTQIAELQTLEVFSDAPDLARHSRIDDSIMPQLQAGDYLDAIKDLGSPVVPVTFEGLQGLRHIAVERVMRDVFGPSIRVASDSTRPTTGMQCRNVDSAAGTAIDLGVPAGQSLMLQSSRDGVASIYLGFLDPPDGEAVQKLKLQAATSLWVRLPDTGKPIKWQLQIKTGAAGMIEVCASLN
jgi:hypothetical protein